MAVDTPSKNHNATKAERQITRSLRGGTHKMRSMGEIYLPRQTREAETRYQDRLRRSVLTNFYTRTVDTFIGRIVRKDPQVLEDTPEAVVRVLDNIDNKGSNLSAFTRDLLTDAVDAGLVYVAVDSPAMNDYNETGRTMADDEQDGLLPYLVLITAEQMLDVHYDERGAIKLYRYSYTFKEQNPDDPFSTISRQRIRVVDIQDNRVRHRIYQKTQASRGNAVAARGSEWELIRTIDTEFERIHLHAFYTREVEEGVGMPLFQDLADLNVLHWQSSSDQVNIEHVIRVPILFAVGLLDQETQVPQDVVVGPNSVVHGERGASLTYVEHSGKAAETGMKALERLERHMVDMGTQIILNRTGNVTATARAIDQAEADNLMAAVAGALESAYKDLFSMLAEVLGVGRAGEPAGGVDINKDFGIGALDAQTIRSLVDLWKTGGLSLQSLLSELKRHGILTEDLDLEEELDQIEADANRRMREMLDIQGGAEQGPEDEDDEEDDDEDDADQ